LSEKFFFSNSNQDVPFFGASVPGFPALRTFQNRNLAISETHIFSSRAINQFRFGFSRLAGQAVAGGTLTDQDVGINRFSDPQEGIIPQTEILGAFELGNSAQDQSKTAGNNFYISDVIFLTRGKHNLRLDTEIFRNQFNHRSDYTAGTMTLLSFPDFLLGLPAGPASAGGNGTSFSNIFFTSVAAGIPDAGQRASAADFFAVDDWKVTRTLTMNLGVRVEVNGQSSEVEGRISNLVPRFYVPPPAHGFTAPATSGFVLPSNFSGNAPEGFPRENPTLLNDPVQTHPEPRVGFAWQPLSLGDLVLRAGYGIYANRTSFSGNGSLLALSRKLALVVLISVSVAAACDRPTEEVGRKVRLPLITLYNAAGRDNAGDSLMRTQWL
jgi:hypothetical protein